MYQSHRDDRTNDEDDRHCGSRRRRGEMGKVLQLPLPLPAPRPRLDDTDEKSYGDVEVFDLAEYRWRMGWV